MVADLPGSYHATEHIHKDSDIDEASFESDVGYIANPDLIAARDVKCFDSIHPELCAVKRSRGLTGNPFHRNREIIFFHQSGDAAIPNGVSQTHQHLRDTPIPVCRIPPT